MSSVMPEGIVEVSDSNDFLTEQQLCRYLVQFILESRGVCHENALLYAVMKLHERCLNADESANWSAEQWQSRLNELINNLNIKLSLLDYKIVRVNHGLGKKCVSNRLRRVETASFPDSTRFYVYVNCKSSDEMKLATRLSSREIQFVKWSLEQIVLAGSRLEEGPVDDIYELPKVIDHIREKIAGSDLPSWQRYCSFTVGSIELSKFDQLNALEIEDLVGRLCELKWLYKNSLGQIGLDIKAIVELEESLVDSFQLARCPICNTLTLQGVMLCNNGGQSPTYWHVDCYQHYITHVGKEYSGTSLITNGVYLI